MSPRKSVSKDCLQGFELMNIEGQLIDLERVAADESKSDAVRLRALARINAIADSTVISVSDRISAIETLGRLAGLDSGDLN